MVYYFPICIMLNFLAAKIVEEKINKRWLFFVYSCFSGIINTVIASSITIFFVMGSSSDALMRLAASTYMGLIINPIMIIIIRKYISGKRVI